MKRIFLASAGLAHLLSACSSSAGHNPIPSPGPPQASTLQTLTVSTGTLTPAFDPSVTDYSVTSLNSLHPVEVTATATDPSATLTIHGTSARSGVTSSFTLQPKEDFSVVVHSSTEDSTTYTVHYLPSDFPAYTVTGSASEGTEDVLLTANNKYLLIVDRDGAPLYYRGFQTNNALDFQQHRLASGEIVYSALIGTSAGAWVLGTDHLMDSNFRDIGDVELVSHAEHDVLPAESHDFILLDEDHYVTMSYVQRTVNLSVYNPKWSSTAPVMNAIVQEVDSGDVLFEWDSGERPSLYIDSVDGNGFTANTVSDYLHLNSIDIDPADGNFLFSLRHTNSILKVDRRTAETIWTLGGAEDDFHLTTDQTFSHQHYVRKQPDGSITVFDNGNSAHQTRIISFVLDEANRKVVSFRVIYEKPSDEPQSGFMGSQQPLASDRYMFGWGGWFTNDIDPAATEVLDGTPVWQITFTAPQVFSYRALPVDRSYRTQ
jgi:hypothetical protein